MASFTLTPVEKGIMRCKHTGQLSSEDIQVMAKFFEDYSGKLLIDLRDTTPEDCARNIKNFRPMMPISAIFGADLSPKILEIPDSYYEKEVKIFKTESEALDWLRNQ
jgi:hypothetical protein